MLLAAVPGHVYAARTAALLAPQPTTTHACAADCSNARALQLVDGRFSDYRWKNGRWDLSLFKCVLR